MFDPYSAGWNSTGALWVGDFSIHLSVHLLSETRSNKALVWFFLGRVSG